MNDEEIYTARDISNSLYTRWLELRRRCRKPRQFSYLSKNIWWSHEFDTFNGFREWSLSNGFKEELSLDRIDNSKGYSPDNCRWATKQEQQYNQYKRTNKKYTSKYRGVSKYKQTNKWRVRIYIDKKEVVIGYFNTEEEGALAYNNALIKNNIIAPMNII